MNSRAAAFLGAIGAALGLLACAPRKIVLLPTPPAEVRKEQPTPAPAPADRAAQSPAEVRKEPPDYSKKYAEAVARTKEAFLRGSGGNEAIPLWKALEESPWGTDAIFNQGVLLHLSGDIDGAMAQYRRITDRSPVFEPAAANLLGIHLLRGDLEGARSLVDRIFPAGVALRPDMLPELQGNIAAALVETGEHDRAALLFLAMRARGSRTPSLPWNMAVLAYRKGDVVAARRLSAEIPPEVANLWPVIASRFAWDRETGKIPSTDNVPATERRMAALAANLGAFEEYRKGNPANAETLLTRRKEVLDATPELLANAGLLQAEQGKWKEARASLERAVKAKPDLAEGWINLGVYREVYEGNAPEALECYRRYVKLNGLRKDEVRQWIEWLEKSAPPAQ